MAGQDQGLAAPELIPVEALFCGPVSFDTADATDGCFCPDGSGYIIKKNTPDNPYAAHNEWLCANLAISAGVPIAPFNIIKHSDGNLWFGSQYRVGEIPDWWLAAANGDIPAADLIDDLSKIYAFDLFVNNVDRHVKNFLVVRRDGRALPMAMDHGRCWMFSGFPPADPPLHEQCNTVNAFSWMKENIAEYPNVEQILSVLDNIRGVTVDRIEGIFRNEPHNWLTNQIQADTLDWWRTGNAAMRVERLVDGVNDGSFL